MSGEDLQQCVVRAHAFADFVGGLNSERTFSGGEINEAVAAYYDLCVEHHGSIVILIHRRRFASAAALVRSLVEAAIHCVAIHEGATDEARVRDLLSGSKDPPKVQTLISNLKSRNSEFAPAMKHVWGLAGSVLHDYAHGGSRQITRRISRGEIGSNISDEEAVEVLEMSNLALMIAAYVVLTRYAAEDEMAQLTEAYEAAQLTRLMASSGLAT